MPSASDTSDRPWNLGRLIGPKPPLKSEHIWAIHTRPQHEGRTRDLALFNTAIDSQKTGRPAPFERTETTRETPAAWLKLRAGDRLLPSRSRPGEHLTTRQQGRRVDEGAALIGLDPAGYGTHSLRRTTVVLIDRRTGNLRPNSAAETAIGALQERTFSGCPVTSFAGV